MLPEVGIEWAHVGSRTMMSVPADTPYLAAPGLIWLRQACAD
jgi:hypothetical protein